ncbi:MAG: starch-binding protein [Bacilli bacterium]|nr:starch-binding protein [Bacilli bacterium]
MFLSKLFKHARTKALVVLAGLSMTLGVWAAISTVAATQQNEVVETKARSTSDYVYLTWNGSIPGDYSVDWDTAGSNTCYAYFYYSSNTSVNNGWPGKAMSKVSDDLYRIALGNASYDRVIFNRTNGSDVWCRSTKDGKDAIHIGSDLSKNNCFFFTSYNQDSYSNCGSWSRIPGYYLRGIGVNGSTAWDDSQMVAADASTVSGNIASWSGVSISASAEYKIVEYTKAKGYNWPNKSFSGNHIHHSGGGESNITCDTAGSYKVFYTNTNSFAVNQDVTISCFEVKDGSTTSKGSVTGNTDILLNTSLGSTFISYTGYDVSYYSNAACTTSITPSSYYPTAAMSVYAKYTAKAYTISYYYSIAKAAQTQYALKTFSGTYGHDYLDYAPDPIYGYQFDGWYTTADCTTACTTVSGTATVYAKMSPLSTNKTYFINAAYSNAYINATSGGPYFHFWNSGKTKASAWPGLKATPVTGDGINDTYQISIPSDCAGFLITSASNSGSYNQYQTVDIVPSTTHNLYVLNTQNSADNTPQSGVWTSSTYYILFSGSSYAESGGVQMTPATSNLAEATNVAVNSTTGLSLKLEYKWYYWDGTTSQLKAASNLFKQAESYSFMSTSANANNPMTFKTAGTYSFYVNNSGLVYIVDDANKLLAGYFYLSSDVDLSDIRVTVTNSNGATPISKARASSIDGASTSVSLTFDGMSYVHKINVYNLRGTDTSYYPTKVVLTDETNSRTATITHDFTSAASASASPLYYVKLSANTTTLVTGGEAYAAEAAFAFSQAIGSAASSSLCAVDGTTLGSLVTKYETATAQGASLHSASATTIETYKMEGNSYDPSTGPSITTTEDVKLSDIYTYIKTGYNAATDTWSLGVFPGVSNEQSPLTLTLWIVLGAGVLGLGAIGAAYFIGKKKKHQA